MKKSVIKLIFLMVLCIWTIDNLYAIGHPRDSTKVYKINYWVTGIIDVGGTAANILSINRIYKKQEMTDADFGTLDKSRFNSFDRRAFKQKHPEKWKQYEADGYYVMGGTIVLPLLCYIDKRIRKNWGDLLLMYYEMHMVTFGVYNYSFLGPTFQNKYRPMVYYDNFTYDERRTGKNNSSFYSGHVASTTASTFFMVKVFSDYHPELRWRKYLLYGAATLPGFLEAFLRVKALKHFPSDNMVGMGLGMLVGIIVPELHKIKRHGVSLGMYSTELGTGLSLRWSPEYKYFRKRI